MKNNRIYLALALSLGVFTLTACGSSEYGVEEMPITEDLPLMTMEQVSENDGIDGNNAYLVVDGIVYDVSESKAWPDGIHNENQAGQDLSQKLEAGPHGAENLDKVTAIGRIEE